MKTKRLVQVLCLTFLTIPFSLTHAQDAKCTVKHGTFVNGGTSTGTMTLEQGSVCRFTFKFGQTNPPDTWELVESPKSGKVVMKDDFAEYQPNDGFTGEDKFVVALFGKAPNCGTRCTRNGRFDFAVTIKPKS